MLNVNEEKFLKSPKEVIAYVHSSNDMLNIVSEEGDYVIMDADEWRNIYETIYLNNIKGLSESIIAASKETLAEAVPLEDVDW